MTVTDERTADGQPYSSDEEIKENVADKINYVTNAKTLFSSPAALCGDGCVRACLAHLDKVGRLKNKFHTPFREK